MNPQKGREILFTNGPLRLRCPWPKFSNRYTGHMHVILHCIHLVDLFSDPGFDENMLRDSGKRKSYWEKTRSDCYPGSRIHQNLGTGRETVFFPLSIRNSVNRKMRNRQMRINRFVIWRGYEKLCQNIKRIKRANLRVNFWLLKQLVFFNQMETKTGFGKVMKKSAGCGIFVKKSRNAGSGQVVLDHYDIFIFTSINDYLHGKSI